MKLRQRRLTARLGCRNYTFASLAGSCLFSGCTGQKLRRSMTRPNDHPPMWLFWRVNPVTKLPHLIFVYGTKTETPPTSPGRYVGLFRILGEELVFHEFHGDT